MSLHGVGPHRHGTRPSLAPALTALVDRFGPETIQPEFAGDRVPTAWLPRATVLVVLRWLREEAPHRFRMLFDLTAIDERHRSNREGKRDFTVVYHLLSLEPVLDLRLKVALDQTDLSMPSSTPIWPNANWYEREVWDMFGIVFDEHPDLRRILMPATWRGHPLRKDHPARATELGHYDATPEFQERQEQALELDPSAWGLPSHEEDRDFVFLNVGPQHPGTHGVLRIALQLDGEEIVGCGPDIGFHHRGAEKMAERQTWHTFIPYTDRIDYLGGVLNNLPYVMAVEQLAGIDVPDRAKVIRIMLCELFRIASHLVWYGTFAQDVGQLSPVFYIFSDRERVFDIVERICGARMHPNWFRIGGVAQDLPAGWRETIRDFLRHMPSRLKEYDKMVMRNRIFKGRTQGIGAYTLEQAIDWGVTGPGLRACGLDWDLRKRRPYGGYDQLEFDIPVAETGDSYGRAQVRVEEIRQSLRLIEQCVDLMPSGDYMARHPLATPPIKARTMEDIETLIHHFLNVSWGPVIPPGETFFGVEASKGVNGYYLVSDGGISPYRARIRTPSFPHLQMLPAITRGLMVPDLLAILGSIDYVLADVDR